MLNFMRMWIGVGRLAASICEARHDDYGPVWPIFIAPWEVHLCCIRSDDEETRRIAEELYDKLQSSGVEVIYDDRNEIRAGEMFADADLLGVPIRVVVSPRNIKGHVIEVSTRDKTVKASVDIAEGLDYILDLKAKLYAEL